MDKFQNKDIIQAVLIADNDIESFIPISQTKSTALIPLVNVPFLDYSLEALNRSGVEEVFVIASININDIKQHIQNRISECCTWSIKMKVRVIGVEGCRSLGDAIRDLDAKGFIRGHFILLAANSVTNANLKPIFEQHKKNAAFDRGAALTVIFKEANAKIRTGNEIMIAMDNENKRLHYHQRLKLNSRERNFSIPLEVFVNNSQIQIYHNLVDPQMAICSPSLLSLFSDNFDFESRDDFIKGLLINEEILDSRIYVALLDQTEYACKVSNWLNYQIVSNDVINRWVYPLVPDMGICCLWQNYSFLRNNIYKNQKANVSKVILKENVVVQAETSIESGSILSSSVIGKNCKIGKNCVLQNAYLEDDVILEDNCTLKYCVIGKGTHICRNSNLLDGVIVGSGVNVPQEIALTKCVIQNTAPNGKYKELSKKAFVINDSETSQQSDSEDEEYDPNENRVLKMMKMPMMLEDSDYNSSSDEERSSAPSPILDDANIFLSEVIDSLARGYQEKSNPDFLILEINSSRYAYNMSLKEVNFNVVKAVFNLIPIKEAETATVMSEINLIFEHLGAVVTNYVKTNESMLDGLKALEECFMEQPTLRNKAANLVHYLYDKEYFSEDAILAWYNGLDEDSEWLRKALQKLVDWLNQSTEEESSESDSEDD